MMTEDSRNVKKEQKPSKPNSLKVDFSKLWRHAFLIVVGIIILYPIIWLVGASFKSNAEIFTSIGFIPESLDFSAYIKGWETGTEYTFTTYFLNTFQIVIPKVIFTVISSTIVAYGFARFEFPLKNQLFIILIATMFLPEVVLRIPMYILWRNLDLLNTYVPLIADTAFAQNAFFVFLIVQFLRSIPLTLDEAAEIDGANSFQVLILILLPMIKPAIVSVVLFQFLWSINDFLGPLIYITSVDKYPVSLALKMAIDVSAGVTPYNQIIAMSILAILPTIILYFFGSKYFIGGTQAGAIKG